MNPSSASRGVAWRYSRSPASRCVVASLVVFVEAPIGTSGTLASFATAGGEQPAIIQQRSARPYDTGRVYAQSLPSFLFIKSARLPTSAAHALERVVGALHRVVGFTNGFVGI